MNLEDLYHWQDTPEEVEKINEAFAKFEAAGLLEELKFVVDKRMTDARSEEAYSQANFSDQ